MARLLTLSMLALASYAQAQIAILPSNVGGTAAGASYFVTHNGTSAACWRNTAFRFQMIYDTANLTDQGCNGPITINRLKFRAANNLVNAGGQVYTGVNVNMSSSTVDYAVTTANTFATNRGADNTLVFSGNVTVLPSLGTAPNDYIIDLTLTTPFTYDPTLGADLIIEVDAPAPVPATVPNNATSVALIDRGRRTSAASATGTTGSSSTFASVCWIEFTGPGGVPSVVISQNTPYGNGCYLQSDSFYEQFAGNGTGHTFDLRGGASGVNSIVATPTPAGYVVTPGTNAWFTPASALLQTNGTSTAVMGDDSISDPLTLPFTFNFPGGSTTVLHACSNGYIICGSTTLTAGDYSPTPAELLAQQPRLAPAWYDWYASRNATTNPTSGVYFDIDPSGQTAYVTWQEIGEFNPSTAGTSLNSFQVAIHSSGVVEYRYGAMAIVTTNAASVIITGISKGNVLGSASVNPGSVDISASMPLATNGPDQTPLGLSATGRPVPGGTVTLTTNNAPVTMVAGVNLLSLGQVNPFLDLAAMGAPGCGQGVDLAVSSGTLLLTPGDVNTFAVPAGMLFVGLDIFSQSAVLVPGVNALGLLTSNGIKMSLGSL